MAARRVGSVSDHRPTGLLLKAPSFVMIKKTTSSVFWIRPVTKFRNRNYGSSGNKVVTFLFDLTLGLAPGTTGCGTAGCGGGPELVEAPV